MNLNLKSSKNMKKMRVSSKSKLLQCIAKGMSTRDIEAHMKDIYGIDVSAELVSKMTDKIFPLVTEWQSRPLG